jgi:tetratricopeptide (TPR) repeat protein
MADERNRDAAARHLEQGLALERANRIAEAVTRYRQAIAENPGLPEAHNALAFYYQRSGLLARAADEFKIVAGLEGNFLAYFNLGYVLVELEQYDEALDAFGHCLALVPDDAAAHFEVGLIHLSRGDFDRAMAYLDLPLRSYPRDWEVHNLFGRCLLGLRRYDEAREAFNQALVLARNPAAQVEVFENLATVERHREFRTLSSVKDQLYAEDGVVYLGSARDDGLKLRAAEEFHFTYADIATTLQRFGALAASSGWRFSAVVAADAMARPVALALAQLLDTPLRKPDELGADERALLVFAIAREAELLLLTLERLPCAATAFCLGLNWTRHSRILPDLVGISARGPCSVPWESELRRLRADGALPPQIDLCVMGAAAAIAGAIRDTPQESNLPRQVRYYTRSHRRVNVH